MLSDWHSEERMLLVRFEALKSLAFEHTNSKRYMVVGKGSLEGPQPSRGYAQKPKSNDIIDLMPKCDIRVSVLLKAKQMSHNDDLREELECVAYLALTQARDAFDPARGVRFWTFAEHKVDGALKNHWTRSYLKHQHGTYGRGETSGS